MSVLLAAGKTDANARASPADRRSQAMIKSFQLVLRVGAAALAFAASSGITPALSQTKQEHVHQMGQTVMPFDLSKTTHVFRMTDSGGVQSVVVKDARDKDQVELISRPTT